jgi:hypothetical protein
LVSLRGAPLHEKSLGLHYVCITWLRAEPCMMTAGRTARGGTGRTEITIQSGRANLKQTPIFLSLSHTQHILLMAYYAVMRLLNLCSVSIKNVITLWCYRVVCVSQHTFISLGSTNCCTHLGSMPTMYESSSLMFLKISSTLSALRKIFFSWLSSFTLAHSPVSSRQALRYFGWYLPHPLGACTIRTIETLMDAK